MSERILHIFVKEKYWNQVKEGIKDEEFREIKPFWEKRLSKEYDFIYYHKGYTSEIIIFKYNGFRKTNILHEVFGESPVEVFAIDLSLCIGERE